MKTKVMAILVILVLMANLFIVANASDLYQSTGGYYERGNYDGSTPNINSYDSSGTQVPSEWAYGLWAKYGCPKVYEDIEFRAVVRGEFAFSFDTMVQEADIGREITLGKYVNVPFSDIYTIDDYSQRRIAKMYSMGALSGYPDGTIKAGKSINRAEAATMIVKFLTAYELDIRTYNNNNSQTYGDVPYDYWASSYIDQATSMGIMKGTGSNFEPERFISVQEVWTMFDNLKNILRINEDTVAKGMRNQFKIDFKYPIQYVAPPYVSGGNQSNNGQSIYVRINESQNVYFNQIGVIDSYQVRTSNIVYVNKYQTYLQVTGSNYGQTEITAYDRNGNYQIITVIVDNSNNNGANSVSITNIINELRVDEQATISVNGGNTPYTYSSSDTSVARIDSWGRITALRAGSTTIKVTDRNYKEDSFRLYVTGNSNNTQIYITGPTNIVTGESQILNASGGTGSYTWTTSNRNIATVSNSGRVTGVGEGNVKITVTDSYGRYATVYVTVGTGRNYNITLNQRTASINVGGYIQLYTTGNTAVRYEVSNSNIATVSNDGYVRGVNTGTTKVTVYDRYNNFDTCIVTVGYSNNSQKPIYFIDSNGRTLTLGQNVTLQTGGNQAVTWATSNDSIVKVDQYGRLTVLARGQVYITVYDQYNNRDEITITVN